jgi:transcription factor TFIIIB component B''
VAIAADEPVTAPSGPRDSQTLQTTVGPTTTPDVSVEVSRVDGNVAASVAPTPSEPTIITDKSREPAASVGISTTDTPSSRTDTEEPASHPPESAITTPSVTATPATEPIRPARKAAPQPPRVPLPTAAPSAPVLASEPTTSVTADQVSTPASTTPQPTEQTRQDAAAVHTRSRATQAATPPVESSANIQESIEATGDAEDNEPAPAPPKAKRAPRKRKPAAETAETDGDAAPAAKKPRRRKAAAPAPEGENQTEGEGSQPPAPKPKRTRQPRTQSTQSGGEGAESGTNSRRGGFRQRSPTPEDAEEQVVDQSQVTMGDLVKDLRIGKKFSRHDELLARQRMKKLKSKMGVPAGNDAEGSGSAAGSKASTPAPTQESGGESSSTPSRPLTEGAPQFQIIDGQIVVNQSTLQFDRHAAAAREAGELEEEIEDDFTHHTTSNTYMKKVQKPNHWNEIETETFYRGLRMFGTDFALLCKMFPGKNRRHVKLKFNREERAHPAKVNAALVGKKTVGIDLEEYKSHTGLEYKSVDEIEAEQARVEEEFEAEQKRAEEEATEEARKRQEELFGKKEEVEKKRGRGRRKKDAGGFGLGG